MRTYVRLLIVVCCLGFPVYAPEASDNPAETPRPQQESDTVAETKQTLNTLQGVDPITAVDTLNGLASAYVKLGKCPNAQLLLDEARTISDQNNYPAGKAEALLILSECQNEKNRALALTTAGEALQLWQSVNNGRGVVRSHLQIGQYQMAQTNLVEATQSFQTALENARTIGDAKLQAESLVYLGWVEFRKGAWQEVFTFSARAENLIDGEAEYDLMGQITSGYADALIESGLADLGLEKYEQALEYNRRAKYPRGIVGSLWGIGKAHYILGQYPQALAKFQEALAGAESHNLNTWVAQCQEYLGRTYERINEHEQAVEQFEKALDWYKVDNPMEAARVRAFMGKVYQAQGNLDKANELYKQAMEKFDALNDRVNQSATLFGLGKLELKRGNYDSAEAYFKKSIDVTENIRRMSMIRDLTAAFSATVHDRYLQYIQCLMRRNQKQAAVEAFEVSESARARSLAEFLRGTETNLLTNLEPELAASEKRLRQLLRATEDARVELLAGKYKKADLESLDSQLVQLENEYKSVSTAISRRDPTYEQLTQPHNWNLERIQEQVISDDDTVLLEYLTGDDKSYVWAVTRNTFTGHEISGDISKAAETVLTLVKEPSKTGNESELTQATQALAQMILAPVADQLNKRRIIVIADGALNYIPFQILPSGSSNQEPLVAQHEVINAPSASILGELREKIASRGTRSKVLAAFGDPVFGGSQNNEHLQNALRDIEPNRDLKTIGELFYAEREINNLRNIASPAKTFTATRYDASRERLMSMDLSQYAILHFATHGFLDPKRPEFSGLLLSTVDEQGKVRQGFIQLRDVYSLRAPVDLVVMSACQTALGKDVRGEGLVGLTRGFMYAGATTVVASLWKVDDEATAELMKRFYIEMLENHKTPDEALRIAQNSIRQIPQWRAPHYWAGFILQGEYRYVVNSERGWRRYSTLISIGIVVLFLMAAAGWYHFRVSSALKK